jgi:hypothetical protein
LAPHAPKDGNASVPPSERQVSPNAPKDRTSVVVDSEAGDSRARFRRLIAPYVEKARASYPQARARYVAGLPDGHIFFVTVVIGDSEGRTEQIFLRVDKIDKGVIFGRIWNDIGLVRGYRYQDAIRIGEADIIDWTISKPDGSEEGNEVGKFLDTQGRTFR